MGKFPNSPRLHFIFLYLLFYFYYIKINIFHKNKNIMNFYKLFIKNIIIIIIIYMKVVRLDKIPISGKRVKS